MKKHNVPALTQAAGMAARTIARMEAAAESVLAADTAKRRSLQMVSSGDRLTALIRHGKTTIQIEGDSFAVTHDEDHIRALPTNGEVA